MVVPSSHEVGYKQPSIDILCNAAHLYVYFIRLLVSWHTIQGTIDKLTHVKW